MVVGLTHVPACRGGGGAFFCSAVESAEMGRLQEDVLPHSSAPRPPPQVT